MAVDPEAPVPGVRDDDAERWEELANNQNAELDQAKTNRNWILGAAALILAVLVIVGVSGACMAKKIDDASKLKGKLTGGVPMADGGRVILNDDGSKTYVPPSRVAQPTTTTGGSGSSAKWRDPRLGPEEDFTHMTIYYPMREVPIECCDDDRYGWCCGFCHHDMKSPMGRNFCRFFWVAIVIVIFWVWLECSSCWDEGDTPCLCVQPEHCCCTAGEFELVGGIFLICLPFLAAILCGALYQKCIIRTKYVRDPTKAPRRVQCDPNGQPTNRSRYQN